MSQTQALSFVPPRAMFRYLGGKARLAPEIIKLIPRKGRKFIDVFAGRANIALCARHEGLQYEKWIVNDIRTAPFLRALMTHGNQIHVPDSFRDHRLPEKEFQLFKALAKNGDPEALLLESLLAWGGGTFACGHGRTTAGGRRSKESAEANFRRAHQLMTQAPAVTVTQKDYLDCLIAEKLTRDDCVIVDGPYLGGDVDCYQADDIVPIELFDYLQHAPHPFVLCEYYEPLIVKLLGPPAFIHNVQVRSNIVRKFRPGKLKPGFKVECLWVGGGK